MPRKPRIAPAAQPAAATPAAPTLQIAIDITKMEILDMLLFVEMQSIATLEAAAQQALILKAIPMLDRLVVGGLNGYRMDQLADVMSAVAREMNALGNPKN